MCLVTKIFLMLSKPYSILKSRRVGVTNLKVLMPHTAINWEKIQCYIMNYTKTTLGWGSHSTHTQTMEVILCMEVRSVTVDEQTWKQVAGRLYIVSGAHIHTFARTLPEVSYTRPDCYSLGSLAPADSLSSTEDQVLFLVSTQCGGKNKCPERVQNKRVQCINSSDNVGPAKRGIAVCWTNRQQESNLLFSECGVFTGAISETSVLFSNI